MRSLIPNEYAYMTIRHLISTSGGLILLHTKYAKHAHAHTPTHTHTQAHTHIPTLHTHMHRERNKQMLIFYIKTFSNNFQF